MSTLNVANISDDQSTLTGSSSNPNDKLNLNTTVDTKFVTNGGAKSFGSCRAAGDFYENSGATLNVSSTETTAIGDYKFSFVTDMIRTYITANGTATNNNRHSQTKARNATDVQTSVRDGSGTKIENSNSVIVMGDLA